MSNRFRPNFQPIQFDPSDVFTPEIGLSRDAHVAIFPRLELARAALLNAERQGSLAWLSLPERVLDDYGVRRHDSELGRILAAAKRMREAADRVIIIGADSATLGARALFDACCHPHHNEQGRGDRGGRPRINFIHPHEDNDSLQGLLDLLESERPPKTIDRRWAILAIDCLGAEQTPNTALSVLLPRLEAACGGDAELVGKSLAIIARRDGWLASVAKQIGAETFALAEDADGGEVLSAAGLLPASIMGIDIVRLLEGAAAMSERFRDAPIGANPALDLAGISLALGKNAALRVRFEVEQRSLRSAARWCATVLESVVAAPHGGGASVNSAGFLSVAVRPETLRRDRIIPAASQDNAERIGELPRQVCNRGAMLKLPAADESALGQWLQMTLAVREVMRQFTMG